MVITRLIGNDKLGLYVTFVAKVKLLSGLLAHRSVSPSRPRHDQIIHYQTFQAFIESRQKVALLWFRTVGVEDAGSLHCLSIINLPQVLLTDLGEGEETVPPPCTDHSLLSTLCRMADDSEVREIVLG